jgi:predicted nucleic acid-binding protein
VSRGWLIDTNIVSEWVKPRPDVGVVRWLDEVDEDRIFLSVISLAEIRLGVERLAPGRRRTRPRRVAWRGAAGAPREAHRAGGRRSHRRLRPFVGASGRPARGLGAMDALIAATCLACDLVLATRNLADFDGLGKRFTPPDQRRPSVDGRRQHRALEPCDSREVFPATL